VGPAERRLSQRNLRFDRRFRFSRQ